MLKIAAVQSKKIEAFQIPFENVGSGINKSEELEESQMIYLESSSHSLPYHSLKDKLKSAKIRL